MAPRPRPSVPTVPGPRVLAAALLGATALLGAAALECGCVQHQARVGAAQPPLAAPAGDPGDKPTATTVITVSRIAVDPPATTATSMQPIDLPVSAWRREADGSLARCETRVQTPLSWWQRFPADAVSDLLPWTWTADADGEVRLAVVPATPEADLLSAARRDGYAHGAVPPAAPEKPAP